MMKKRLAIAVLMAAPPLKEAGAFVTQTPRTRRKPLLRRKPSPYETNNNLRERTRYLFQSTTGDINSISSRDSEEDFVFIAPQALYNEDPNDQRYSASDWLANVKSLPRSTILRTIQGPVISVMAWSLVVSLIHGMFKRLGARGWAEAMCISSKPHSFLVSALGLLLVFRTNSAYQRFAEGRKIWENILSISRNISRLTCLYAQDMGSERQHRIFRLLGAFPYLLHHHIQPQCLDPSEYNTLKDTRFAMKLRDCADYSDPENFEDNDNGNVLSYLAKAIRSRFGRNDKRSFQHEAEEDIYCDLDEECNTCMVDRRALPWCLLPPSALHKCADSANRPLWVCDRLSQELTDVPYSDNFTSRERLSFLSQVDKLSKCIGECERITQTAVPLNYARHSLRSLTIWLFSLPFALVGEFGLLTAPVMGVISWLLFGVYQIGSTIEDPFQGSLRLSMLCDAVYRDVMYDADLGNKRDSAFDLEEELYEWDRLGPIEDSKLLLSSSPAIPPQSSPPSASPISHHDLQSKQRAEDQHILYNPDLPPANGSPASPPSSSENDDPMQPRP